jgi:hypothetical protein
MHHYHFSTLMMEDGRTSQDQTKSRATGSLCNVVSEILFHFISKTIMDPKIAKLGTVTRTTKGTKESCTISWKRVKASATARKQIVYVDPRVPTHVKLFLQCILVCHAQSKSAPRQPRHSDFWSFDLH